MKFLCVCILTLLGLAIISHVSGSPAQVTPIVQQSTVPVIIDPSAPDGLICPVGYKLATTNSSFQNGVKAVVNHVCNGITALGYVHVWCENPPEYYSLTRKSPHTAYSCKRIENQWANTAITGSRG